MLSRGLAAPALTAAAAVASVAALVLRDPHAAGSWGACPVLAVTGLLCPGCGGLRAVNDLANGRVVDAVSSNLLVVVLVVGGAAAWAVWTRARVRGVPSRLERTVTPVRATAVLVVLVVFTVLRNAPVGAALAP